MSEPSIFVIFIVGFIKIFCPLDYKLMTYRTLQMIFQMLVDTSEMKKVVAVQYTTNTVGFQFFEAEMTKICIVLVPINTLNQSQSYYQEGPRRKNFVNFSFSSVQIYVLVFFRRYCTSLIS